MDSCDVEMEDLSLGRDEDLSEEDKILLIQQLRAESIFYLQMKLVSYHLCRLQLRKEHARIHYTFYESAHTRGLLYAVYWRYINVR